MEVTTRSGQSFVAETSYPKGHRRDPIDDSEVDTKFRCLSAEVLPVRQCDEALKLLWSLEDLPNLEDLINSLIG